MLKQVTMKNITVGYAYVEESQIHYISDLIFQDWLYSNCSAQINEIAREITLSEEEYTWLIIAYPSTSVSKYVIINFDNYKKEYTNGQLD